MPSYTNKFTDCLPCCGCTGGYMKTIFGNESSGAEKYYLCDDAAIRSKPVVFLAEFTIDKSGITTASPACLAALPDSFKAKFISYHGPITIESGAVYGMKCQNMMKACTGTTFGDHPSHPDFRLGKGLHLTTVWGGAGSGSPWFGMTFQSVFGVASCDGGSAYFQLYQPGAVRITSFQCSPFQVICSWGTLGGNYDNALLTAKFTLATDCSDPYGRVPTPPPPPPTPAEIQRVTLPCIHLGDNIEDPATCGCGTAVLRKCAVHGQCRRTGYPKAGEQICLTCPDYQSP